MAIPAIIPYPMPTSAELPAARLPWQIDSGRAVLLVHDMQRYFLRFFPEGAAPVADLVRNTARIRQAASDAGIPVVYTAQPGDMTRGERGLLYDIWGPGMGGDPADRAITAEIAPQDDDVVLTKWRYSAFVRSPLADLLTRWERNQLIICGVYAHIGCLMTANDAFALDIQPFLVGDAIADFSVEYHRLALEWAAERCAATVTTTEVVQAFKAQDLHS